MALASSMSERRCSSVSSRLCSRTVSGSLMECVHAAMPAKVAVSTAPTNARRAQTVFTKPPHQLQHSVVAEQRVVRFVAGFAMRPPLPDAYDYCSIEPVVGSNGCTKVRRAPKVRWNGRGLRVRLARLAQGSVHIALVADIDLRAVVRL